ncbi:hypothetical protein C8N46_102450 [Kordia periserrulae]|uniref:Adhesin domain-containing protein n=1 Tax=Kordia periserrulae TaxID=701523 RepID=A0A2T6C3Z4_9FLAO|nr:hypothetical protein [Kordia periserrulae]PTX63049.1 hypothetical protein C8N46_102450 [Kordia periserrulae]
MNNKPYKVFLLLVFFTVGLTAQTEKKYQKTFYVTEKTQLRFQTNNIDVTFKTWNKDEVKVDFSIDFKNYSEKEIKNISDNVIVSARMQSSMDDTSFLQIENNSQTSIGRLSYQLKSGEIRLENLSWDNDSEKKHKSVSDIHREIDTSDDGFEDLDGYVLFENGDKVPLKDIDNSSNKQILSIRSQYVVYVPKYITIDIMADNATITFDGTFTNVIRGNFKEGTLQAETLQNEHNNMAIMNGNLKVKEISGGRYMLRNISNGLIGELENTMIDTEFSKISVGEIKKNVKFRDFKSKYFFYNLGENFESIEMFCEYSDINIFNEKKQHYYLEAYGHDAILNDGGTKIVAQPSRDGKKSKMFTIGKDDSETRKNTFKLDIVHGFVTLLYR